MTESNHNLLLIMNIEKVKKGENDKQKKIKEEEDNEADLGFDDPFFTQELLVCVLIRTVIYSIDI